LHGEAIAIGMICEAFMALEKGMIDQNLLDDIEAFLFTIYGKVNIKEEDLGAILEHTLQDKKNKGNEVRFSLLNGRGGCAFDVVCTKKEMKKALLYYMG
jgi:3-dehydroquinate synthase